MVFEVVHEFIIDVALSLDEYVAEYLSLDFGKERLHDFIKVAAEDRLDFAVLQEVKELVH